MKIVIEPQIYPNETLSSWLIRGSILNGSQPNNWVHLLFNDNRIWNKDIDRFLSEKKLVQISKYCSKSINEFKNMTLEPLIEKIFEKEKLNPLKSWSFVLSVGQRGSYKRNGMYFCPLCLSSEKKIYFRLENKLAWNTSCFLHNIKLLQRCENCNKNFTPHKITYDKTKIYLCTNCGYDLRNSKTQVCNLEIQNFQAKLNKAIFENIVDESFPLIEFSIEELFKTLRIILSFIKALFRVNKYECLLNILNLSIPNDSLESINNSSTSFEEMHIKDREFLILISSKLFNLKIYEIKEIFEKLNFSYKLVANQSTLTSKTISYLSKDLKINTKNKILIIKQSKILPKSADEVNKLLEELKSWL
ncbi:TniQ family protein [Aliarcobacter butzleri]|uniref:TniQ family protein n=1 Tax=Aliarcobacter butzleri TaxID=28197 RepID=UPI00263F6188|nr:TniQ family protein [Aliarcobacter butzleri]MDN5079597.1 TniQ family protein [Aliarcobacter butzleri]